MRLFSRWELKQEPSHIVEITDIVTSPSKYGTTSTTIIFTHNGRPSSMGKDVFEENYRTAKAQKDD
ncbi:hypothetical protein ACLHDG_09050 [Sulfurovum sp. CS9]|uniref:hypothetical protein n=1 Tax=Sulfurovum sp. CS9 TaxID=3391146 RepID=UPI0039EAC3B4